MPGVLMPLAIGAAIGLLLLLLIAAVAQAVADDGYGTRQGPRSHHPDGFAPREVPAGLPLPTAATVRRYSRLLGGLVLYGLAIALLVRASIGVGPWDVLSQGVARVSGLPFGLVTILIGAAVLVLWWPLRQRPGVGTVANVLLVGTAAQVGLTVLPPQTLLAVRVPLFAAGMVLLALATAVYIGPGLGAGPRDGLMLGLRERGLPIWLGRTLVEGTVLLIGWLLGGDVGIGSLVFAVGIGPLCGLAIRLFPARRNEQIRSGSRSPASSLSRRPSSSPDPTAASTPS